MRCRVLYFQCLGDAAVWRGGGQRDDRRTTRLAGIYAAGFFNLLGPYAITVGLLAVAMFAMHGAIFLHLKTTGELCERTYRWTCAHTACLS